MIGAALLALVFSFTVPANNVRSCGGPVAGSGGARWAKLYGLKDGQQAPIVLLAQSVRAAGRDSIVTPDLSGTWHCWVTLTGPTGIENCPSNVVVVNGTTTVPEQPLQLALRSVRGWLLLDLPSRAGTRLDLYDVQGRRVGQMQDELGPGRLSISTQSIAPATPGVYFATLIHGGKSVGSKVIVVR